MSENIKLLLSDEYVLFAKKIAAILDKKKAKEGELKQLYDQIKAELKTFEAEAEEVQQEWEAFKSSKECET